MSGSDFYGPELPSGLTTGNSTTVSVDVLAAQNISRKRQHSSSSSLSKTDCDLLDEDGRKSPDKRLIHSSERVFGPALPVGFSAASVLEESDFIGPVMPPASSSTNITLADDDEEDDDDLLGPSPALNTEAKTQATVQQIEFRAKLMKNKLQRKVIFFDLTVFF